MACVCHYTTVNYNTLGTLVKTIGGELSGLYGSQIPADFNVFHKTPSYFFFLSVFSVILLFSTYLNCHWNKCAF